MSKKKIKEKKEEGPEGICCQTGCEDCPYDFGKKVDPNVPAELQPNWNKEAEIYEGDIPGDKEA